MSESDRRRKRLYTAVVVALSVALFACGGPAEREASGESAADPEKPAPALASAASVGSPAPSVPDRPPIPAELPQPSEPEAQPGAGTPGEIAFGTPPAPEPAGEETESPEPAPPPRTARGGDYVFTNADLARYKPMKEAFGMRDGEVTVTPDMRRAKGAGGEAESAPDPSTLSPEERQRELSETERRIAALTAENAYLRTRVPSLHNPLLPRVAPSESDSLAEAGMDNAERLARVNQRVADNEALLDHLRRRLAELHQMGKSGDSGSADDQASTQAP